MFRRFSPCYVGFYVRLKGNQALNSKVWASFSIVTKVFTRTFSTNRIVASHSSTNQNRRITEMSRNTGQSTADDGDKELVIIDTDCGVDDALAILLSLASPKHKILGITCVGGNTGLENVCSNVLRVLKVAGRLDIPVFRGVQSGILGQSRSHAKAHGDDGFGGIAHTIDVDQSALRQEHAVTWMADSVARHNGHVTLLTLGPLTNVSLAHLMYPQFSEHLKSVHVMGGVTNARGNMSPTAEFNFYCDPEAANIVMTQLSCPVSVVTFDLCLEYSFPWDWYKEKILGSNSARCNFLVRLMQTAVKFAKDNPEVFTKGVITCDLLAAALLIDPSLVELTQTCHVTVELAGHVTRGQMIADWRNFLQKPSRVEIVQKVNKDRLMLMYENMLLK